MLFLAISPDLDFIPGLLCGEPDRYHHDPSHSLVVGLVGGLIFYRFAVYMLKGISKLNFEPVFINKTAVKGRYNFIFFGLFLLYLIIRVLAWQRSTLLEDHDGVSYLYRIRTFLSFALQNIIDIGPGKTR